MSVAKRVAEERCTCFNLFSFPNRLRVYVGVVNLAGKLDIPSVLKIAHLNTL